MKSQIWIAVATYLLVAIARKRLDVDTSLHTLLQILSTTIFERIPIKLAFSAIDPRIESGDDPNQLNLFGN